jgi:hypothetical protein
MHHLCLHPHGRKRSERSEKEISSLDNSGENTQSEQLGSVRHPDAQPSSEVGRGEHDQSSA